ncbi:PHP domain-containing protein [Thiovibrio frasassiensis]|uniref:PHP domain-containing protein n=1 Tax=Thiovibrio frasassiensis TaxID=2984131 RepID=A0A9X4MHW8_9BACT|nr:PHP domain-containing protein [Thiovibrio frasassiensis]MDG4476535.1 PHP domain-containing protein [Thiovibrio frasassiensis]
MTPFIDLHTHSTCSDGLLTPTGLLNLAARRGLAAIALTDHDTVTGLAEALIQSTVTGVEVITGIEISSDLDGASLHILGYGFDHKHPELLAFVARLQEARRNRNQGIIDRLQSLGIAISNEELSQIAGEQIGRPHFARLLTQKRLVKNTQDAFSRYLKRGAPAYVEHDKPRAEEVIRQISAANGLAVLAHPLYLDPSFEKIPALVAQLSSYGLAGLEAIYPTHSQKVCRFLQKLAAQHGLLLSGGTDYHGDKHSVTPLGGNSKTIRVPYQLLQEIKQRMAANALVSR